MNPFIFLRKYYTYDVPKGIIMDWRWFWTHSSIIIQILLKTIKHSDSWLGLQSSIPYWSMKLKNLEKQLLYNEKENFTKTSFIIRRMLKKRFRFQLSLNIDQPHPSINREFQFCHQASVQSNFSALIRAFFLISHPKIAHRFLLIYSSSSPLRDL